MGEVSAQELERMAKKLMRDARDWRKADPTEESIYVQGVCRGLYAAAKSCRRRAKRLAK